MRVFSQPRPEATALCRGRISTGAVGSPAQIQLVRGVPALQLASRQFRMGHKGPPLRVQRLAAQGTSQRPDAARLCDRRQRSVCTAAARVQGGAADGRDPARSGESIDAEWQKMRMGPLWQSLDAELDRCWASQQAGATEELATSIEDSWDAGDAEYSSTASASPTLEGFGGAHRLGALWPLARSAALSSSPGQQTWLHDLSQVYVILFGVGSTDTEGIYSLRVMSRDDGLPQDTIIAFSSKEDAERYAGLLEATMDHVPSVCPIEPSELLDFCTDSGYSYRVEAQGSLLIPPDYYVGITDWERSLRLREGKWTVMERDLTTPSTPAAEPALAEAASEPLNNATFYPLSENSSYLLEEARARLERLLPRDC